MTWLVLMIRFKEAYNNNIRYLVILQKIIMSGVPNYLHIVYYFCKIQLWIKILGSRKSIFANIVLTHMMFEK